VEHIVFLTGRLAEPALERVLEGMDSTRGEAPFTWEVRQIGVQVAALMNADLIARRVAAPVAAGRIMVPGRCSGDLDALSRHFGIPVERGPQELKDLPRHFRRRAAPPALDRYDIRVFAEIVDAPRLAVEQTLQRARAYAADGADVIDLGCLPGVPYPHLEDCVRALREAGHRVSVDSLDADELLRAGRAGADYLLSLKPDTLWIAEEVAATPVLIPREPHDEASLWHAVETMQAKGRAFLADPILDPLPFGLLASLVRYHRLRERFPDAPILMGVGNLTELTEADTSGINAILLGIAAELRAAAILTTQVSPHARRAVREADWARRIMHAAVQQRSLPKGIADALLTVHDREPFVDTPQEIAAVAAAVRDPSFRVQVAADGLHVYNRDGLRRGTDPFALWPQLRLEGDAAHAFYMGVELTRAQTAWELGKRYVQDQPLDWGCAVERAPQDFGRPASPGSTLSHALRPAGEAAPGASGAADAAGAADVPRAGGGADAQSGDG
jgi:dihydropteroate synthase